MKSSEGIREMYVNDRNDYLMILSIVTENHGKTQHINFGNV